MPFRLATERQQIFYRFLLRHQLPVNIAALFENLDIGLDFLEALNKALTEKVTIRTQDQWLVRKLEQARQRTWNLSSDRFRAFLHLAQAKLSEEQLSETTILQVLCSEQMDQALKIWELILQAILTEDINANLNLFKIVAQLMALPSLSTWPLLTKGLVQQHPQAQKLFRKLLFLLTIGNIRPKFTTYKQTGSPVRELALELARRIPWESDDWHRIPVAPEAAYACNHFYRTMLEKKNIHVEEYAELLSWYCAYQNQFEQLAHQFWEEIRQPMYGLRPGGRDVVAIKVSALNQRDCRYIQLIPEVQVPNVQLRVWWIMEDMDFRYYRQAPLKAEEFQRVLIDLNQEELELASESLLKFIGLHCLWKIMTGKIFRPQIKRTTKEEEARKHLKRAFLVRPHFRWLPPGYAASDRAIQRSLETFQYLPPEGKTFVKSDLTWDEVMGIIPLDTSSKPLLTYTDEDLGYN